MTLVGYRAKNHPQQATRDDVDDRRTPPEIFNPLHRQHRFTIDAAASPVNALLPRFWTREDDALSLSWRNERVWCNPPYSGIGAWVGKAWDEMADGDCALVVMLLPGNRCEQAWWQTCVESYRDRGTGRHGISLRTRFLAGRPRFGWPPGRVVPKKGDRPPFGLVLLTWERVSASPSSLDTVA